MVKLEKQILNEIKRDFQPLFKYIKSAEILRGKQNELDEPIIGNFAKYAITYAEIRLQETVGREARNIISQILAKALDISINQISDLDFYMEPRDPRMVTMYLLLEDGTEITVPLIDKSATEEE